MTKCSQISIEARSFKEGRLWLSGLKKALPQPIFESFINAVLLQMQLNSQIVAFASSNFWP